MCKNNLKEEKIYPKLVDFVIWEYANGGQFLFGGTQRDTILIRGYLNTIRLRTPVEKNCSDNLQHFFLYFLDPNLPPK